MTTDLIRLASDLIALDSRSGLANLPVANRIEAELAGFEVERLDYADAAGTPKRVLVAHRGPPGGYALSGHMDTVPETGWRTDPWAPRLDEAGMLHGLGSADMKGPIAAAILAARSVPAEVPATLILTTDEETTKAGARQVVANSALARRLGLKGIVVCEPTRLRPVRGHRSHISFTAVAEGVQAHSSTGIGVNANWALIPFLAAMRDLQARLRGEARFQDADYDPPFCDFNLILDNHGTAINVTPARATARIKFRHSAKLDPRPVIEAVEQAAAAAGIALEVVREGAPPELPKDHPFVALAERVAGQAARTVPFGTDASILQDLAPCVILGPGDIACAHTPQECVPVAELEAAQALYRRVLMAA